MGDRAEWTKEVVGLACLKVGTTNDGRSLATLGLTLKGGVERLKFTNVGAVTIYVGVDTAGANDLQMKSTSGDASQELEVCGTSAMFKRLKFYVTAAGDGVMNVVQMGD